MNVYEDCMILSLRFPQKLWRIVNECKNGAIRWGANGNTILLDYKQFQKQYLDAHDSIFKTKNITSFIRQLNLYGFRKVTSHNRDPICNSHNPNVHEFLHENFRTGRPDLLSKVCRKTAGKIKYFHRFNSRNTEEEDFIPHSEDKTSRLKMCRLALTKTLEQIAQEYRKVQFHTNTSKSNDSFAEATNSRGTVSKLFGINAHNIPRNENNLEPIAKDPISLTSKKDNTSKRLTFPWCFRSMDEYKAFLRFENTN